MNQQMLDGLLIDRACGALAPDVSALIDAYLEKEPAQRRVADEIESTVRLAMLASPPPVCELPPLKVKSLRAPVRLAQSKRRRAWWPAELAAAFAFGAALAVWIIQQMGPPLAQHPARPAMAPHDVIRSEPAPGFWSIPRLVSLEKSPAPARSPRLTWKTLTGNPQAMD